ncbi:L,D-transpeptidase [Akkermansiaceae bacterium]|nr:L,D-transpeptidase [Akkermansiaceae bacterium]
MPLPVRNILLLLACLFLPSCSSSTASASPKGIPASDWAAIKSGIAAQRQAGHPSYNPDYVYVVDPAAQRMHVISLKTGQILKTLRCGTGKRGLGFAHAQTPPGFFTMGGVRIAKNANSAIQTGDSKRGVSGIYAEILYPPTYPDPKLRGYVPNGVVIHSYNPDASEMLRQRRAQRMIGRIPCTTGCPVPDIDEAHKLIPYLKKSAGKFDPTANPNANLRSLISQGQVSVYQRNQLGDPIYILNRQ